MPFDLDPIFRAPEAGMPPPLIQPIGDAPAMRAFLDDALPTTFAASRPAPDVVRRVIEIARDDGVRIRARWYWRAGDRPGSAVVFAHGGGMVGGSVAAYDAFVAQHVQWTGVPMLSVEYRRAPDVTGDKPARDVFSGLSWVLDHAVDLGVDPKRVAVMGDSAGGGLAAAAAILARDERLPLAAQILIFPMLDDRTTRPDPHLVNLATWTHEDNEIGWRALLGSRTGTHDVSPLEAPARLREFTGLAPAFIEVGGLDIFRDESIAYARGLLQAGVTTELHVHPSAPHGYDSLALESDFAGRWRADRVRVLTCI